MKITYDAEVDVLRIILSDQPVEESDEDKPGIIIDYDAQGNVVSMEILDASKRGMSPHGVEYAITGLKGA
jgi:YD repeat-containing protein